MDHRQLANDPSNAAQHQLHPIGFTRPDVTSLFAISTAQEYDVALVQSPPSLYAYLGGLWTLLSFTGTGVPVTTITTNGQAITFGCSVLEVGSDSSHAITTPLSSGTRMKVFQNLPFTATLTVPSGWNFSDGNITLSLGYLANCSLTYYSGNVVVIEYNTPGVTS